MRTLTSLCSCLVTWSIGCIAPSRVSVMREMWSSSVGPTVSVSMLKPRRANSPEMRVRTPGLFSTRIERTCLRPVRKPAVASRSSRLRSSSLVPGSPMTARLSRPCRARPGRRDHRVDVLLAGDRDVDDDRAGRRERGAQVLDERGLVGQADARAAVGLGELDEVGPLPHVDGRVALLPEELLPLADHAEVAVVHHDDLDVDALLRAGGQLLGVHLERAVAREADDEVVGAPDLRAHRRGQAEPHRPSPPDWIQRRGSAKWKYWAAHIWCWPMSVARMQSPPVAS